mgnify:CR=1 FL=1
MADFPKHLTFLSDESEMSFVEEIVDKKNKSKERFATYVFSKSMINLGVEIPLSFSQIEKLINDKRIKTQNQC